MKILIYGLHFKPDLIGIGKYTGEMSDWLQEHNHEIRVITAPHFYPEWKKVSKQWFYKKEINPYLIWRCPIYVPSNLRGFTRLFHLISFAFSSIPILIKNINWNPDYIISIEPPFFSSPFALLYAKLSKSKSIIHIQDLEIDAAFSLNILRNNSVYKIISKIEKYILNKFDKISTISNGMKKVIVSKGIDKDKIIVLPNWADLQNISPNIDNNYLRKRLKINSNKKVILYAGNMGEKQNLISIINVAETVQENNSNVTILMVGNGASKVRLINEAKKRNLKNISFLPLQPTKDLGPLLTLADIHLITQNKNIFDYVLPSKLTNILSAGGVSIIAAKKGTQLSKLVHEYNMGYLVNPDSEKELYDAIIYLLNNEQICNTISKNARKYAEQYLSKERILNEFVTTLLNQ